MKKRTLTAADLDAMFPCHGDKTEEKWIHSVCHVDSGLWVCYDPTEQTLELVCRECRRYITTILVAE